MLMGLYSLGSYVNVDQLLSALLITAEVEQLLGPEQRATLQQNVTPNVRKISTVSVENIGQLSLIFFFSAYWGENLNCCLNISPSLWLSQKL